MTWTADPITFEQVRERADDHWCPAPQRYLPMSSSPDLSTWTLINPLIWSYTFALAGKFYFSDWNIGKRQELEALILRELPNEDPKRRHNVMSNVGYAVYSAGAGSNYPDRYWGDHAIKLLTEMRDAYKGNYPSQTAVVAWLDQHIADVNNIRSRTEKMIEAAVRTGLQALGLDDPKNYTEKRT